MNALLYGLFSDHSSAQRAVAELRRALTDETRIGVLLRRSTQSMMTAGTEAPGMHIGGDDVALLALLGATYISADGYFLAGGILADRMRDVTGGSTLEALLGLSMRPQDAQESLRCVEDGDILVLVEGAGPESAIQQILATAGATNLAEPPVKSQIRQSPMDTPQTAEPTHVAEGPGTETTSLHHAKGFSAHTRADGSRRRAAARDTEIANTRSDETEDNPPAPQP